MKIAIVGGSPSSEHLAPYDDLGWEIWVHGNQFDRHLDRRVAKIFEIHNDLTEHAPHYAQWLVDFGIKMVVGDKFPITADHVEVFPYEDSKQFIGQKLTSTPAYMMAYALLMGATEIGIYGVDMSIDDHEYFYQRPSMYAWIGYAQGLGVKVTIPEESGLYKDSYVEGDGGGKPELGLPPFTEDQFTQMANMHQGKIDQIEAEITHLKMALNAHSGSLQTYQRLSKVARGIEAGAEIKTLTEGVVIK